MEAAGVRETGSGCRAKAHWPPNWPEPELTVDRQDSSHGCVSSFGLCGYQSLGVSRLGLEGRSTLPLPRQQTQAPEAPKCGDRCHCRLCFWALGSSGPGIVEMVVFWALVLPGPALGEQSGEGRCHLPLTGPWLAAADAAHLSSILLSPASCSWSPVAPACRLSPNHVCFSLSREGSEITGPCQSQDPEGSERKRPTNCGSELHGSHSLISLSGLRSRM